MGKIQKDQVKSETQERQTKETLETAEQSEGKPKKNTAHARRKG